MTASVRAIFDVGVMSPKPTVGKSAEAEIKRIEATHMSLGMLNPMESEKHRV